MSNPWANPTSTGWYPDPLKRGLERYFDGTAWTGESRSTDGDNSDAGNDRRSRWGARSRDAQELIQDAREVAGRGRDALTHEAKNLAIRGREALGDAEPALQDPAKFSLGAGPSLSAGSLFGSSSGVRSTGAQSGSLRSEPSLSAAVVHGLVPSLGVESPMQIEATRADELPDSIADLKNLPGVQEAADRFGGTKAGQTFGAALAGAAGLAAGAGLIAGRNQEQQEPQTAATDASVTEASNLAQAPNAVQAPSQSGYDPQQNYDPRKLVDEVRASASNGMTFSQAQQHAKEQAREQLAAAANAKIDFAKQRAGKAAAGAGQAAAQAGKKGAAGCVWFVVLFIIGAIVWGAISSNDDSDSDSDSYSYSSYDEDDPVEVAWWYLDAIPMGPDELISQLEYEGFDLDVAESTVENLDVDWDEQAMLAAVDALEYGNYSKNGLIETLEGRGFTNSQATDAVDLLDIDETVQAAAKIDSILEYSNYSRAGLIERLIRDGFDETDATAAVDAAGINWNEQAFLEGTMYLDEDILEYEDLRDQLEYEQFTEEEIEFALEQLSP